MIRDQIHKHRSWTTPAEAAVLLLIAQSLACPASPAPPAASSEPPRASAAPPTPSASASAAPSASVTHEPGTVPAPSTRKAAASPDAGTFAPPTFTRLPAAKTRKAAAAVDSVSFPGKGALVALSSKGGIEIIDPANGAGFAIGHASPEALALSEDGSLVAVSGSDRVTLWNAATGALLHTFPIAARSLELSRDGKRLALGGDSLAAVRDTASGAEIMRATPDFPAFGLAFGNGGKELVITGNNVAVAVYAIDTGKLLPGGGTAETTATFGLSLSPDGRWAAASAPAGHGLQVFDVHAWGPRTLVVLPEGACREHIGPAFSPSGRFVFAYGGQRWVKGFEVGTWKPYASYHAPPGREIQSVAGDLSRVVVTRDEGRGAAVVNVSNTAETKLDRALESGSYAISADGLTVAGVGGGAARAWSAKTGKVTFEEQP